MATEKRELQILMRARDLVTKTTSRISRAMKALGNLMSKTFASINRAARTATAGIGRVLKAVTSLRAVIAGLVLSSSVGFFTSFESGMAQVATLVDTSVVSMDRLADGVLRVGRESGDALDSLTSGLFDAISAGVKAEDAIGFLSNASKLAVGGGTSTAEAIKGVVSILNAYGLEATEAQRVSDSLFTAMQGGITTVGDLASNVGKVAPIARQAGISIEEMLAAISALTKGGLSTEAATTALRAALQSMLKPTEQSIAAATELGIRWDQATLSQYGLLAVLRQLSRDGLEPTAEQQAALAGSVEGFVGVAALAVDGAKNLTDILGSMRNQTGATDVAFGKVAETLDRKLLRAWNSIKAVVIEVVGVFADDLKRATDAAREFAENNTGAIRGFAEKLKTAVPFVTDVFRILFDFLREKLGEYRENWREILTDIGSIAGAFAGAFADLFVAGLKVAGAAFTTFANNLPAVLEAAFKDFSLASLIAGDGIFGSGKSEALRRIETETAALQTAIEQQQITAKIIAARRSGSALPPELAQFGTSGLSLAQLEEGFRKGEERVREFKVKVEAAIADAGLIGSGALQKSLETATAEGLGKIRGIGSDLALDLQARFGQLSNTIGLPVDELAARTRQFQAEWAAAGAVIEEQSERTAGWWSQIGGFLKGVRDAAVQSVQPVQAIAAAVPEIPAPVAKAAEASKDLLDNVRDIDAELRKLAETRPFEAFSAGFADEAKRIEQDLASVVPISRDVARDMHAALAANFFDLTERRFRGFGEFVKGIFRDILTSANRILSDTFGSLLTKGLSSLLGSLFGGPSGPQIPNVAAQVGNYFQPFAQGGVVTGPTAALIGEGRYNEAVVPLPDGRRIPVDVRGDRGGGDTYEVHLNLSAADGASAERFLIGNAGAIVQALAKQLASSQSAKRNIREALA